MSKIVIPWLRPDRRFYRKFMQSFDPEETFSVNPVYDVGMAIQDFRTNPYPLILTDLECLIDPNDIASGIEVIRRIRAPDSMNKNTSILATGMFKSNGDSQLGNTEQRCLEAGATAYLSLYGLDPSNLVLKVKELIRAD